MKSSHLFLEKLFCYIDFEYYSHLYMKYYFQNVLFIDCSKRYKPNAWMRQHFLTICISHPYILHPTSPPFSLGKVRS